MTSPPITIRPLEFPQRGGWQHRRFSKSLGVSLAAHAFLLVVLWRLVPEVTGGTSWFDSISLDGTIGAARESLYDEDGNGNELSGGDPIVHVGSDSLLSDLGSALPQANAFSLTNDGLPGGSGGVHGPDQGPGIGKGGPGAGGKVRVFGVEGTGSKFVYVFDRSSSMEGSPLRAAQAELIASLECLKEGDAFQIIFYNQRPTPFRPSGVNQLSRANPQNKELAGRFIGGITAAGATRHEEALLLALSLNPDAIFFLTDGDEPRLSAAELYNIQRSNRGRAAIHAIEFGHGPPLAAESFLSRLARQNGGKFGYVDVTTFERRY